MFHLTVIFTYFFSVPSLPEPTLPPPPVPTTTKVKSHEEPIYEAVIHLKELPPLPEMIEKTPPIPQHQHVQQPPAQPPPPPHAHHVIHQHVMHQVAENGHKLRPKSPAVIRSSSPAMSPSSPKHSRPSSRASSTGGRFFFH